MLDGPATKQMRAPHSKSRLGCLTCKARHIRCDSEGPPKCISFDAEANKKTETHPSCIECTSTGRTCAGYPAANGRRALLFKHTFGCETAKTPLGTPAVHLVQTLAPWPDRDALPLDEAFALEYFASRTVALLGQFFPSTLWTATFPCMAGMETAVRRALGALGAWHAATDAGSRAWAHGGVTDAEVELALMNAAALQGLADFEGQAKDTTLRLACCLLLMLCESCRRERSQLVVRVQRGIDLVAQQDGVWDKRPEQLLLESRICQAGLWTALHLDEPDQVATKQPSLLREIHVDTEPLLGRLESCARRLHNITVAILVAEKHASALFLQLENWAARARQDQLDPDSCVGARVLWARYELARLFLTTMSQHSQTCFDLHTSSFERIVHLLEPILRRDATPAALSADLWATPLLYYTARLCRHSATRTKAIRLLQACPRREGPWSGPEAAAVAKAVMRFEEQNAMGLPEDGIPNVPEDRRVRRVVHDVLPPVGHGCATTVTLLMWVGDGSEPEQWADGIIDDGSSTQGSGRLDGGWTFAE